MQRSVRSKQGCCVHLRRRLLKATNGPLLRCHASQTRVKYFFSPSSPSLSSHDVAQFAAYFLRREEDINISVIGVTGPVNDTYSIATIYWILYQSPCMANSFSVFFPFFQVSHFFRHPLLLGYPPSRGLVNGGRKKKRGGGIDVNNPALKKKSGVASALPAYAANSLSFPSPSPPSADGDTENAISPDNKRRGRERRRRRKKEDPHSRHEGHVQHPQPLHCERSRVLPRCPHVVVL